MCESLEAAREALTKINTIRNSIIGLQSINWSEHIYPLVAALDAAGIKGMSYPEARENFGTMLERTNAAEAVLAEAEARGRRQGLEEARTHAPEGWKLVPVEATPEMLAVEAKTVVGYMGPINDHLDYFSADEIYRAMVAAAPAPAETQKPETGESVR